MNELINVSQFDTVINELMNTELVIEQNGVITLNQDAQLLLKSYNDLGKKIKALETRFKDSLMERVTQTNMHVEPLKTDYATISYVYSAGAEKTEWINDKVESLIKFNDLDPKDFRKTTYGKDKEYIRITWSK